MFCGAGSGGRAMMMAVYRIFDGGGSSVTLHRSEDDTEAALSVDGRARTAYLIESRGPVVIMTVVREASEDRREGRVAAVEWARYNMLAGNESALTLVSGH